MLKQKALNFEKDYGVRCNDVRRFVNFIMGGANTPTKDTRKRKIRGENEAREGRRSRDEGGGGGGGGGGEARDEGNDEVEETSVFETPTKQTKKKQKIRKVHVLYTDQLGNTPPTDRYEDTPRTRQRKRREWVRHETVTWETPPTSPDEDFETPPTEMNS